MAKDGQTTVTLYGYRETTDPLPEDQQFDGYEPGNPYFAPTGETVAVLVRTVYEVMP